MKKIYLGVLLISLIALLMAGLHAGGPVYQGIPNFIPTAAANEPEKSELPPLILDDEEPLLLEDHEKDRKSEREVNALTENQPCFVCHVNYQEETLASTHARGGISCVQCHGPSFAHRNDENNTTPPDIMFPADQIETLCVTCHLTHNSPAAMVIAMWQKHCPDKKDPLTIVCTDCHGQHRLKVRTVHWDKKTRALLPTKPKPTETNSE